MSKEHPPLIEPNQLDEKKKASMKSRVIVGLILAAVGLPCMFLGSYPFFVFISFFLIFAVFEIIRAKGKRYAWPVWVATYILAFTYVYWGFIRGNITAWRDAVHNNTEFVFTLETHWATPYFSLYASLTGLGFYFVVSIFHKDFDFSDIAYFFTMTILVGIGFQCMLFLRFCPLAEFFQAAASPEPFVRFFTSAFLFMFVMIGCFGNDIMAYFVGVFFGKHKMNPRVSPNKSWEGFFGGWILGGLLAFGFAMIVDACGYPLLPTMVIFTERSSWWMVAILSFTLPLIGVVGDLSFSLIKRYFGFKDYGNLLKAHGGVLDRADSLIFCCIYGAILVTVFQMGVSFFVG